MAMRLRSLQALHAVMETGSVTEAAKRLYRTQPQVSRLIAGLEEELGFRLFSRRGRRLVATQEGLRFYDEARRILSGLDDISRIAEDIRTLKEARLRIVAQPYLAHAIVPQAMAEFAARYPLVRYSLEIRSRRDVGQWIAGQQFDLGIAALPIDAPAVTSQPFASVAVAAILPRGHRLAEKSRLDARDLVGEPFIALNPLALLRHRIDSLFADLGLPLSVRAETSSGLSACQLAAKGLGVTLADPLVARCLAPGQIEVREWDPGLRLTYGFLYSTAHAPSALVLDFADTVARAAKQMEPAAVELLGVGR
jgi:DNA-binding transcriptional LysR family regulator